MKADAGQYRFVIEGIEEKGYKGSISKTFSINKKTIKSVFFNGNIEDDDYYEQYENFKLQFNQREYNGEAIRIDDEVNALIQQKGLVKDVDYSITSYYNNRSAGTATITITGKGNYSGTVNGEFTITRKSLSDLQITVNTDDEVYRNSAIKKSIVIKDGDTTLRENVDYQVEYTNNKEIGTAHLTITAIGNYIGNYESEFEIVQKIVTNSEITRKHISSIGYSIAPTYTGHPINENISLVMKDGYYYMVKDVDYTVTITDNINAGDGKIIIQGIGDYSGTVNVGFTIRAVNIEDNSNKLIVNVEKNTYSLTETPKLSVKYKFSDDEIVDLVEGKDFTVAYRDENRVGTATAVIMAQGNYTGMVTKTFDITSKNIGNTNISIDTSDKTYTGNKITIPIVIKDGNTILKDDVDYTVSYKDNINIGTATVIIDGKGNYSGRITRNFKIVENVQNVSKVEISSVKNVATKSAKVTWKKDSNVDGYEVYMAEVKKDSKKMKTKSELTLRKSTSTKSKALVNIPKGALVQIIKKNVKKSGGYTWYKVKYNGKTGYVASKYLKDYYKTSSYKKVKTITNKNTTTHTQKKLTKNKKYSFKIRAYKNASGKTYYGDYSNIKEVTIKK